MVRERQDKVGEWQENETRMNRLRGAGKSDDTLEAQMAELDRRIGEIDERLAREFPDYAALASPKPLSVEQAQKLLGPDEALVLLLDTPKAKPTPAETFIWAVTRDRAVWKRTELGGEALREKVALLRKELDPATMTRSADGKRGLVQVGENRSGRETGFSLTTAHELYSKLLGPVAQLIEGKKLLLVANGPLTGLPFQVLVKARPDPARSGTTGFRNIDWLIRHHALTTLPSVSSLKALRGIAKTVRRAKEPLIGFGDPVFASPSAKPVRVASVSGTKRGVTRGYASFFKGRNADLAALAQSLPQLDGTRRELLAVGKILGVDAKDILLGREASEEAVKAAKLDQYRIVYFATHGLIAGDVKGLGEPALAFSLPAKASDLDDGLLTASEVTQLKMNAEWLVMSACNTAAGDKPGAEALSGLARAFFYAGARALLVSHWKVPSDAAVRLTTGAFAALDRAGKAGRPIGRAEALRQSITALMTMPATDATPRPWHPATWAPFVVVGEGGM